MTAGRTVIGGGRVVTPGGVLDPGRVVVRDGVIEAVEVADPCASHAANAVVDIAGGWLLPGFVDIHCHGGGGFSYAEADVDDLATAVTAHRRHGTTTTMASLVSRPVAELVQQISRLSELVQDGLFAGIHVEGPFISAARCGAHDTAALGPPDRAHITRMLDAGRGSIRMVTIAPELDGGLEAIRQLRDAGVIAAIGHTDATEAQIRSAIDAGATVATHLFNGMPPLHHRQPGPVGALLDDSRVAIELICDLVLVHPTAVRIAARYAGAERTVLTTDAMAAAAFGDGEYRLGGLPVTVRGGIATVDGSGVLAASTLTMDAAVRNFVRACGMTVPEAVAAASARPAHLLGLSDRIGAIRPGAMADLVVLDDDLQITQVMHQGRWVRHSGTPS